MYKLVYLPAINVYIVSVIKARVTKSLDEKLLLLSKIFGLAVK